MNLTLGITKSMSNTKNKALATWRFFVVNSAKSAAWTDRKNVAPDVATPSSEAIAARYSSWLTRSSLSRRLFPSSRPMVRGASWGRARGDAANRRLRRRRAQQKMGCWLVEVGVSDATAESTGVFRPGWLPCSTISA